ncbi:putative peptidyl-tRNA hydrolase PTRHD1 [Zea mays]|uniref:peptidyl-tRNA hydrolase n=2 Tax=Zea mays TaxID=4577 RepID=A0A8J8YLZ0_MAIZE|nr:Peptidyl-tRNA hydrolase II (PTH2) family protein [Zea mays]PWZ40079.1 putative peptidyl-tRNA hydrolase PTRHD1 [Zea mays]
MLTLLPLRLPFSLPVAATLPNAALLLPASTRVSLRQITQGASMNAAAASSAPDAAAAATGEEGAKEAVDVLVQYVVLRRDLADAWPLGSVVAQGCHAAVAAVWAHRDHPDTAAYCAPDNLDRMHKAWISLSIVSTWNLNHCLQSHGHGLMVTLEVKGETQLNNLAEKLAAAGVRHKLWIEQPENIPTCIATAPCPKSQVSSFFKKLKLCK